MVNKYLHDLSMLAFFLRVSTVGLPVRLANIYVKMQKVIRTLIVSYMSLFFAVYKEGVYRIISGAH